MARTYFLGKLRASFYGDGGGDNVCDAGPLNEANDNKKRPLLTSY